MSKIIYLFCFFSNERVNKRKSPRDQEIVVEQHRRNVNMAKSHNLLDLCVLYGRRFDVI